MRSWKHVLIIGNACLAFAVNALPSRPFVLINSNELHTLREELAKPGWKADLYRTERGFSVMNSGCGVRANADLWLRRTIEIPQRGGHFHNFYCSDGERLEVPTDQRFVPGPYRCPKCGREYSGERFEGGLRRLVHGWLAQAALDLALVSAIEDKPEYARKAAEILQRYAVAYPGPHTGIVKGGMLYQSLDEAMWVIPLAQAYDLIYERLSPAERRPLELFLNTVAYGFKSCEGKGNWESWHLSAMGVVGYATGETELIDSATAHFQAQIADELGDDGLWPESVHTYHYFPLLAFIHFAEAAWHAGNDLYHWEAKPGKSLLSMFRAPLEYAYPDLRLPAINDGWFQSFVPADDYELAFYRTGEPLFGWVLANSYKPGISPAGLVPANTPGNRRDGLYAFLFGKDIPTRVTPPKGASINFPGLGICILRSTNGATMTFDYGPFLGHGQFDKMGITLFANDKLWLADYGTPGYGAEILRWYQSTFGHNTIVVDGKNQQRTKENSAKLWLGGSDLEAAQSVTQEAYPGVSHTRTVVRIQDIFVVVDRLEGAQPHTYDLYLHSEGELSFNAGERSSAVWATNSVPLPNSPWIEKLVQHPAGTTIAGRWSAAGTGIAFWLGSSTPMLPMSAECPGETGARKIPLLIARQQTNAAEFVTVLAPYRERAQLAVTRDGPSLKIQFGSTVVKLSVPSDGTRPALVAHN
jgi:hypothetical protein